MKNRAEILENTPIRESRFVVIGYAAIAFICAMILWFYVADYDTIIEKTFTNITVDLIEPEKPDLTVVSGTRKLVNVTVYGRKADINKLSAEKIRALVDVSGAQSEGTIEGQIIVELPDGISLVPTHPLSVAYIPVTLAKNIEKDFQIKCRIVSGTWSDIYTLDPKCTPEKVAITGASETINRIDNVVVSIDVGDIQRPKIVKGRIELLDEDGERIPQSHLSLTDTVTHLPIEDGVVSVYVWMYMEKELPITIEFTGGVFSADDALYTCSPKTVKVWGGVDKLEKMEFVVIPIDETTIESRFEGIIKLPDLGEDIVYLSGEEEVFVSGTIRDVISHKLKVQTRDIKVTGLPEGLAAELSFIAVDDNARPPETLDIIFWGSNEAISAIRKDSFGEISITVDFENEEVALGDKFYNQKATIAINTLQGAFTPDKDKVFVDAVIVKG